MFYRRGNRFTDAMLFFAIIFHLQNCKNGGIYVLCMDELHCIWINFVHNYSQMSYFLSFPPFASQVQSHHLSWLTKEQVSVQRLHDFCLNYNEQLQLFSFRMDRLKGMAMIHQGKFRENTFEFSCNIQSWQHCHVHTVFNGKSIGNS